MRCLELPVESDRLVEVGNGFIRETTVRLKTTALQVKRSAAGLDGKGLVENLQGLVIFSQASQIARLVYVTPLISGIPSNCVIIALDIGETAIGFSNHFKQ